MEIFAGRRSGRIAGLLGLLLASLACLGPAGAQTNSQANTKSPDLPAPPFEDVTPGQTTEPNTGDPSKTLILGQLHWAPIASQCSFTGGIEDAPVMTTDETQPLVFVTMASPSANNSAAIERGYIMANGIVRELERGKSSPDKEGRVTTLWRSAGEPRINVSVAITETMQTADGIEYDGSLTVHWGDKKETMSIQGRCVQPPENRQAGKS
ncbi:hypothetical protein DYI37_04385 [Fulvimarina endophytica]|uniref:Uncharacterized protein n=1 Tax=Fulvimarina endophytica TaxID=2293836 RepID=A0A371X7Q7_9HYPH|nr:hypothetical protein DYI37_04385 [Fulvimarina endophytica]